MIYDYVDILLGSACNRNCEYCLQRSDDNLINKKANAERFLLNILDYFYKNKIESMPTRISYWGGEPLLYFKTLKYVHDGLDIAGVSPTFCSRIATNGTLIDDEYIEWANNYHDVRTTISLHGNEFTDDQIKNFGKLKNFIFTELITHKRNSFKDIEKWYYRFCDIIGREVIISPMFIKSLDKRYEEYFLTKEDVDKLTEEIIFFKENKSAFGDSVLKSLKKYGEKFLSLNEKNNHCVSEDRLSVDLLGNRYLCHHDFSFGNIIGNIFNDRKRIPIKNINYDVFYKSEECADCKFKLMCRGGCPISLRHSVDCYLSKKIFGVLGF